MASYTKHDQTLLLAGLIVVMANLIWLLRLAASASWSRDLAPMFRCLLTNVWSVGRCLNRAGETRSAELPRRAPNTSSDPAAPAGSAPAASASKSSVSTSSSTSSCRSQDPEAGEGTAESDDTNNARPAAADKNASSTVQTTTGKTGMCFGSWHWSKASATRSRVEHLIEVEKRRKRAFTTRATNPLVSMLSCGCVMLVMFKVVAREPRWYTSTQDLSVFAFALVTCTLGQTPIAEQGCFLPFIYSVQSFLMCIISLDCTHEPVQMLATGWMTFGPRLLLGFMVFNVPVVFFWSCLYFATVLYTHFELPPALKAADLSRLYTEFFCLVTVTAAAFIWKASSINHARKSVESRILKETNSATTSLLDLMCDVVIELDDCFRLTGHTPRFSALVTLDAKKNLEGMSVTNYVASAADRERFEQQLRSVDRKALERDKVPGSLHVTLKDSIGNLVEVELYFVAFLDLQSEMKYIIGLKEREEGFSATGLPDFGGLVGVGVGVGVDRGGVGRGGSSSRSGHHKSSRHSRSGSGQQQPPLPPSYSHPYYPPAPKLPLPQPQILRGSFAAASTLFSTPNSHQQQQPQQQQQQQSKSMDSTSEGAATAGRSVSKLTEAISKEPPISWNTAMLFEAKRRARGSPQGRHQRNASSNISSGCCSGGSSDAASSIVSIPGPLRGVGGCSSDSHGGSAHRFSPPDTWGAPGTSKTGRSLALPELSATKTIAKELLVMAVLKRSNFWVENQSCCPFHAAINDLRKTLARVERQDCSLHFLSSTSCPQCQTCGALATTEDTGSQQADVLADGNVTGAGSEKQQQQEQRRRQQPGPQQQQQQQQQQSRYFTDRELPAQAQAQAQAQKIGENEETQENERGDKEIQKLEEKGRGRITSQSKDAAMYGVLEAQEPITMFAKEGESEAIAIAGGNGSGTSINATQARPATKRSTCQVCGANSVRWRGARLASCASSAAPRVSL